MITIPVRAGGAPSTSRPAPDHPIPHQQLDQIAPAAFQEALFERARRLPGVTVGRSLVSLPDARAFHLDPDLADGPAEAFQRGTEFAHLHGTEDGSLHLTLPPDVFDRVIAAGWGEPHPISGTMMLFGPRDGGELETVWEILQASYRYATGQLPHAAS